MSVERLHVGSGQEILPDWVNIDSKPYPGVDHVMDVSQSFPFKDAKFIFAEHFIEHLPYAAATTFLKACRAALREDGVLRLSTPNLDWVWITQYHYGNWGSVQEQIQDCFGINRGFHGWGHQFLYNLPVLTATLNDAGFAHVKVCRYRESDHEALRGIERHEQYLDTPELPHVIVVEAWGRRTEPAATLEPSRSDYLTAVSEG
jgi:predicted SAM-dependent methyltransferase